MGPVTGKMLETVYWNKKKAESGGAVAVGKVATKQAAAPTAADAQRGAAKAALQAQVAQKGANTNKKSL